MHSDMLWLCCFMWRLSSSNTSRLLAVFSTHTIVLSFYITPTGVRSLWSSPRCLSHTMESSVVLCQASAALWKFQGPRWQHWIPGGLCVCERKMDRAALSSILAIFFCHLSVRLRAGQQQTLKTQWHLAGEMIEGLFIEQLLQCYSHWAGQQCKPVTKWTLIV